MRFVEWFLLFEFDKDGAIFYIGVISNIVHYYFKFYDYISSVRI